jgi:hypothetical protein
MFLADVRLQVTIVIRTSIALRAVLVLILLGAAVRAMHVQIEGTNIVKKLLAVRTHVTALVDRSRGFE